MNVVLAATCCIFINIIQIHSQIINSTDNIVDGDPPRPLHQKYSDSWQSPYSTTFPINSTISKNYTELEILMKQREYILQQLQEAVEDGKKIMKKNNSTLTLNDLDKVKELYESLLSGEVGAGAGADNATDDTKLSDVVEKRSSNHTAVAGRRHKELKLHLFDFVSLSSKKNKFKDKAKEMNRIIMQGKIDEWLLNRELEKKKIKSYIERLKKVKFEDCPRQGISRRKKKKKTRRFEEEEEGEENKDDEEKEKENEEKEKKKKKKNSKYTGGLMYPCCRKCCKRSYLGCL